MDRIAFIVGDIFLYWNSVLLTMAAGVAVSLFLAFYLYRGGSGQASAVAVPMALVLSLVLARLVHWYFRPDSYAGFLAAVTDYTVGGYALPGAFLGCLLTAQLLRLLRLERDVPKLLDAMSLGGCGGIAVGRLSCIFNTADRGWLMEPGQNFAWPAMNVVTGAPEYRFATFFAQALAAGTVFCILLLRFRRGKPGDVTLLFLLLYGMSQTVLDSTRYDALTLRSNGFLHVSQLLGAAAMVFAAAVSAVRLVRSRGFRWWYLPIWLSAAALLGGAGYMEYYVQRHGNLVTFSYSIMAACLAGIAGLTLLQFHLASRRPPAVPEEPGLS